MSKKEIADKLENTAVLSQEDDYNIKMGYLDPAILAIIHRITERWDVKQIEFLSEAEYLWPYYMRGLWVSPVKLTSREIKSKGEAILVPSHAASQPAAPLLASRQEHNGASYHHEREYTL